MSGRTILRRARLSLLLALAAPACGTTSPDAFVEIGSWGGDHALLAVTANGGTIEFDCAHGVLPAPITLNHGAFDVAGEYFPEHGGPIRVDDPVVRQPSRYRGTVDGRSMTLRVTLIETGQDVGTYTLTHGASGRVFKCL
jgi:hypothetical protein